VAAEGLLDYAEARCGRTLRGKWTLEEVLGVGGMATVYRAVHRNGAQVAIKLLHPELSLDRGLRERFLREGYVGNRVGHEGAVKVLDDDVDEDGTAFLVMELLDGETIEQRWENRGGRLPLSEVIGIAYHAADVLAAAHSEGIVHRDVKPENLFLTRNGKLKILDFGVARLRERSQKPSSATQQGTSVGTPAFMPPEQARGRWEEVDGRTDVWSLGATMFTLLSGALVHETETVAEQIIVAATKPARSVALVMPELPKSVVALVDRALAFEKSKRFETMDEMRAALQHVAESPGSERPAVPVEDASAELMELVDSVRSENLAGPLPESAPPSSGDESTRVVPALQGRELASANDFAMGAEDLEQLPMSLRLPAVDDRPTLEPAPAAESPQRPAGTSIRRRETPDERRRRRARAVRPYMLTGIGIAILGILTALWLVVRSGALGR
jgi:serine/threonine protein kinase